MKDMQLYKIKQDYKDLEAIKSYIEYDTILKVLIGKELLINSNDVN